MRKNISEDEISFNIGPKNMRQSDNDNLRGTMIQFFNFIEGVKTRYKNLHWAETVKSRHETIDDFLNEISSFEDELAESYQGSTCQFNPTDIVGINLPIECPVNLATVLKERVMLLRDILDKDPEYVGEVSLIDDFLIKIKKFGSYLMRME